MRLPRLFALKNPCTAILLLMNLKLILPLVLLFVPILVLAVYLRRPVQPTQEEQAFLQACNDLTGKHLTFETIKPLKGACAYLSSDGGVGIEPCTEHHV